MMICSNKTTDLYSSFVDPLYRGPDFVYGSTVCTTLYNGCNTSQEMTRKDIELPKTDAVICMSEMLDRSVEMRQSASRSN